MSDKRVALLANKLIGTRKLAHEAREAAAKKVFDIGRVSEAITMAASSGMDTVAVMPDGLLDLRQTKSALEATKLLKDAGFEVTWHKRQLRPDEPDLWYMVVAWNSVS